MKRIILGVLFLNLTLTPVFSQRIQTSYDSDNLFYLATEQFREKEFPSCYRTIETWFSKSENPILLEEAGFIRAAAAYELNKRETSILLIQFLENYPNSPHAAKAYYFLGCSALNAGEFTDALAFYKRCPENELSKKEFIDYQFRFAYCAMRLGDYHTARTMFGQLMEGDNRYIGSATYFTAYMDYAEGNMKEAMRAFTKISAHTQYKEAIPYFNLQLLYADGRLDEMLEKAEELRNKKQSTAQRTELIRLLGAAWFDKGNFQLSLEYYLQYLTFKPVILRSDQYRIGVDYYTQRNYIAATDFLSKISDPKDAVLQSATYHLGLCYLKQGKNDMARMSFEQASLSDFDLGTKEKALYNYALLCYETSFSPFNEQVKAFQRILTEFPKSQFADKVNGYLAEVFLSSKEYEHSLSVIQKISNPDSKLLQTKCQLQFLLGVDRFQNQRYPEANQLFTQSIELAGKLSIPATETFFWRGETNFQLGQLESAMQDYKKFAESQGASKMKAYPIVSYNLGYCCFNLKKYTDALKWFEKFTNQTTVKKEKNYSDALNRMGDCYFRAKDYTKAEKFYQDADLNTPSGNDYAIYQKAFCLGLRKQYKAKIDLLSQFETRFPQSDYKDDAIFETGRTYILLQKPDQAIGAFNTLMSSFQESPLSRKAGIQIALLFYNQGKKENAINAYKKVIEQYPGSEEAQVALSDLKMIYVNSNTVADFILYTKSLGNNTIIETGEQDSLSFMAAEQLLMANKNTEAIQSFQSYLQNFVSGAFRTDSHYHLGRLLLNDKKKEEALEHLDTVANKDGNKYQLEAAELTAETYFADKDFSKALSGFSKLEKLSSDQKSRISARLGKIRCQYLLKQNKEVLATANLLIKEQNLSADILRETRYYRAMSMLAEGRKEEAKADLELVSSDSQTAFGAEARFRIADLNFERGAFRESEKIIQDFIREGTSQSYWLARCFILLADINLQRKDDFQAKQYLLSLKENYKVENDIQEMISTRLSTIAKRND